MSIIEQVKNEVLIRNKEYIEKVDSYDFWNNHIKFVVNEALKLASVYSADKEIVELGALLHDIALVSNVGTKADHHTNGAKIAEEILTNLKYPQDKRERVVNCVLHHRSSKNAENIEELCVCDADILAHFDNIPMIFFKSFTMGKMTLNDMGVFIQGFQKDYDDLSDRTKETFKDKYENIMQVLFGENWRQPISFEERDTKSNHIETIIHKIADLCKNDIKSFPEIKCMDYVDIFPRSEEDRVLLNDEAIKIGNIIEKNERGTTYRLNKPISTELGNIELLKIRKFDETRLPWLGAGDFIVNDFDKFKNKYQNAKNCKYVEAPTYNAIEIKTDNTLAYVMDIPTSEYYKTKS